MSIAGWSTPAGPAAKTAPGPPRRAKGTRRTHPRARDKYGPGPRMPIKVPRALLPAALDGSLRNVEFRTDKYFGFAVPTALPGVPSEILDPVNTWKDKAEFDKTARALVGMFQKNFAKFEAQVDADVRAAAPDLKLAAE